MTDDLHNIRDAFFRILAFESDADILRKAGIRIGSDKIDTERRLFEEELNPFPINLRHESLRMATLYAILYCFENSVRQLIADRLEEKYGSNWKNEIPKKVTQTAANRQKQAKDQSWLEGSKDDILSFCQFGDLASVIVEKWEDFSDLIPTQHWLRQRMDELEHARNFIAHNRPLLPGEYSRITTYIGDWNRQVGV